MKRVALLFTIVAATLSVLADYTMLPVKTSETMGDFIRFESRDWAAEAIGEGGRLSSNTIWTGEHVIVNDLYVTCGVTLTMSPGTHIKFSPGTRIKIEDGGSIVLLGENGNEVVLTGIDTDASFTGIVLQSGTANYYDNGYVVADGFSFGKFATVALGDVSAFVAGGQAIIPVTVSGSRDSAFSFDWVAETNGVQFASGTMNWGKVGEGTKNIIVPFGPEFAGLDSFTVKPSLMRCCTASKPGSIVTLSEFIVQDIHADEAISEFIGFESRDWVADIDGMDNVEGGRLSANTVWTGEHIILGNVYVPSGVTLTIASDAIIRFCEGTMIKIEDGGKLDIIGAEGHDVVLNGYESDTVYAGVVKMPSGTVTDNGYVRVDKYNLGTLAKVALNSSETFRTSGLALIPVTVSGSRNNAFSIDWLVETNGVAYKTGILKWNGTGEGTKNIAFEFGSELDGIDVVAVRVSAHRACFAVPDSCTVTIRDFDIANLHADEAMGGFIRFESRDWASDFDEAAIFEGGRLTENAIWTGEHVIFNDLYIPSGVTLTIAADAQVRLCEGTMIKIEDGGALRMVGLEGHDVVIGNFDETTTSRGIVKMSSGTYSDNMYVQYLDFRYGNYPDITIHSAEAARDAGKIYIPLTLGGASRNQAFNVDWVTDKGAKGTITWNQSGEGTKWIEIPVDPALIGGGEKYGIRLTAARGANIAVSNARLTICEYDNPVDGPVVLVESEEPSLEFAVRSEIKHQPIFLNQVEEVRYSGRWQNKLAPESVFSRVSIESDNGVTQLGEWPGAKEDAIELDLASYNVGHYTLCHQIVAKETRKVIDIQSKSFSIVDKDDVELHGGMLMQNETWKAGKTHVVYETVIVPSIYTLFIEPGAIVKFMTGTGIDISQGGALFANAIIFTHINDDTIGGDTLSDGYTVAPPMDSYELNGNFTFGVDTEIRYITQASTLTGTISDQRVLSRGSTYRVSGTVTVANGASLMIPSGTVLKMETGASIVVNAGGRISSNGTRAAPVIITSMNDDSYSGKMDGSNSNPQPGDWTKITINGTGFFDFTKVLYSSRNSTTGAINMNGGTTTFINSEIAHCAYDAVGVESGHFYMTNSIIADALLAFRHWAKDPIVNCVIYDCGRLTQGGGQHFVNCVFSRITETWEAFGFPQNGTTYNNCCFWNEGGSVLTGEGTQDAMTVCGKNGNVWGNPLFIDPDNYDFRISEMSPCIDAADSLVAPTRDLYGQPRLTVKASSDVALGVPAADIGVCEVMLRSVTSDIDLEARSVRGETNAVPGKLLFVKWEVANVGGSPVDVEWRDTISLVSEDGLQEVTLGDKKTSSTIAIGGTAFCSAYFTVPAMAEGKWYPKVNVNSYHDIFEGTLTANNVLIGSTAIDIETDKIDASEGDEGVVSAGSPKVLKMSFAAEDENRMVRIAVPEGVTVSYGFGFVPRGANASGKIVSSGSEVLFKVPDGVTDVYVSLESDKTVEFAMTFEDGNVVITSVTPDALPSSGEVTITIKGAGFVSSNKVLLMCGGEEVSPRSVQYVDAGTFVITTDCSLLRPGSQCDVKVVGEENVATAAAAISVAAVEGKPKFWARLVVPDAVRQGRRSNCYVEFGNSGNADSLPRILQVSAGHGCSVIYAGSDELLPSVHYVAASTISGRIASGDVKRIPFEFVAGSTPELILYVDDGSNGEELASAVSVVAERNADFTDYRLVFNELDPNSAIGAETYREYRACLSDGPVANTVKVSLSGTSGKIMSVSARNIKTGETYMARLGAGCDSEFWDLPSGTYRFEALAEKSVGSVCAYVAPYGGEVSITLRTTYMVSGTVAGASPDDVVVFSSAENSYYGCVGKDGVYSCVMPAGQYDVFVITSTEKMFEDLEGVAVGGEMTLNLGEKVASKAKVSSLRMAFTSVPTITDYDDSVFENKYTQARKRIDEGIRLLGLAGQLVKPTGEYDCPHNREIYYDNYRTVELFRSRLNAFMNNARMADPYKALALTGKTVHDMSRAYLDVWMASKGKLATRCYGNWAGGIFNAKKVVTKYIYVKGLDAIESQIGSFENDVKSLQYLIDHRELSLEYVEQVLDKIASLTKESNDLKDAFDSLRSAGVVLSSDVDILDAGTLGDIWDYINVAGSIAEVISDLLKTGESFGEWIAGRVHIDDWMKDFEKVLRDFANKLPLRPYLQHCCSTEEYEDIAGDNIVDQKRPSLPKSVDPNEMGGIMGRGDGDTQRYVKPGEWMTYTVYFENKSTAMAAAQEVKVSNPLSLYLDWSTFEMGEVAFNNQIDLELSGKQNGTSEVTMNGTSYLVRSKVTLDKTEGKVDWYLRIVDPSTPTTWPDDVFAGFLPPNDATYRGEGHLTYRIKVRDDAPAGVKITNAASIVFDYNDPIETDPAWWNQVAKVMSVEGSDGKAIKVSVDPSWIKTHVGESATDAEVATALNATGANGLKVWTSIALGLDPENPEDKFLVDVPQNADENSVAIKALSGELPTNVWMAIQYRLDRDATGCGETSSGTAQSGQGLSIDIGGAADPTGIYQVKAVLSDDEGSSTTEVPAANQIGILRKTAANKREIVPVPWTKFAAGAEDIAVSNLVKTAGLAADDKLYVYDDSAKRYATWELQSDKTWKPLTTVKMVNGKLEVMTAESPEIAAVRCGSGVWIERQNTNKPITLVGQFDSEPKTTQIDRGTSEAPKWNLVASPAITNWNLNVINEGVGAADRIIVPTGKEPRIYTRNSSNSKWGYISYEANDKGIVKPVRKEDDTEISPGTGFWYISEGGAPMINW